MLSETRSAIEVFVGRLHQRSPLTSEETDALLALRGTTSVARANVDIVSMGETAEHVCLVLEGLAGSFGQVMDGRRQITALHVAGDMCDLHSLVGPKGGWTVQALSLTAILRIPHAQLRLVARTYPNVAEAFWRDCSVDASILSQWVVNVGRRDARSRLAHLLCEMGIRLENAGLGSRDAFKLQATQTQLGDALGLTPVHVNRTVRTLRDAGLVAIRSHDVRIRDWDALALLGDFEDEYLQVEPRPRTRSANLHEQRRSA